MDCVECADSRDDLGAIAHCIGDSPHQVRLLGIGGGGRLARRAVDDQRVVALLVDEIGRQLGRLVEIEAAADVERSDHGSEQTAERTPGIELRHMSKLPPAGLPTVVIR